jgi:hypothetical protein
LDPIGFDAGDNNWYRFVANGPVGRVDPSGLFCGECFPPSPGYTNEFRKKLAGIRITTAGQNPTSEDAGLELLNSINTLQNIQAIGNIVSALAKGPSQLAETLIEEAVGQGMDLSGLAPGTIENFKKALRQTWGYSIFVQVQYESCDPCCSWNPFMPSGQKYWWQTHTKYHMCTQGASDLNTYGGTLGNPPSSANVAACIREAIGQ